MHVLTLLEDRLLPGAECALPALHRVLFAVDGPIAVSARSAGGAATTHLASERAWYGSGDCVVVAGEGGARVLRFELDRGARDDRAVGSVKLAHPIDLVPGAAYLMRCDRVDFAPGGIAHPHRHKGGGIRCLLRGRLTVTVGEEPAREITPGDAWFESGREPVLAEAAADAETSFVRVAILPADIRGQSSIVYVDPQDAARGKPRRYTVFIDEPIDIAARPPA